MPAIQESGAAWDGAAVALRYALQLHALARQDLAAEVRAQDPERHFKGLPESPEVIAAYDAVRNAEKAVALLEREGKRS